MKHKSVSLHKLYKVEGNGIKRLRRHCPRCGEGVFLAEHKDRVFCGNCHYSEIRNKK